MYDTNSETNSGNTLKNIRIKNKDIVSTSVDTTVGKPESIEYSQVLKLFNSICKSYPPIQSIAGKRKESVGARWKEYGGLEAFQKVFEKAEQSDFMKGNGGKGWKASFDWIIKPTNFPKVMEGVYDNQIKKQTGGEIEWKMLT